MESAHITETVEGVDPASVEPVTVRVHSRKHTRALDPQGLYQQALSGQTLHEQELDEQVLGEQESGHQVSDQDQSGLQEPTQQQLEQHEPATQALDSQSGEDEVFETASCETFDASPVEQAEEEETARAKTPTGHSGIIDAGDSVSKKDLVALLESFVRVIKTDDGDTSNGTSVSATTTGTGTGIELSRERGMITNEARVDDRTVEIDQLRGLVIEAQDTIIKLLTDRVDDRSRIATLEAQLNLLPDLQAQADRAMSVAVRTEEYRSEINKMKFELDRFRLFRVRVEAEQKKGSVFNRIQKWLFSRPNAKDETLQRISYQKMVDQSHIQPNIQPVGQTNVQASL